MKKMGVIHHRILIEEGDMTSKEESPAEAIGALAGVDFQMTPGP